MGHRWIRDKHIKIGRVGTINALRLRSFLDLKHETHIVHHSCEKCGQWMTMVYSDIVIFTGLIPPKEYWDQITCEEIMIRKILIQ